MPKKPAGFKSDVPVTVRRTLKDPVLPLRAEQGVEGEGPHGVLASPSPRDVSRRDVIVVLASGSSGLEVVVQVGVPDGVGLRVVVVGKDLKYF